MLCEAENTRAVTRVVTEYHFFGFLLLPSSWRARWPFRWHNKTRHFGAGFRKLVTAGIQRLAMIRARGGRVVKG
jgi:hypothetical protein